jgi:outer membrane lipoprotein carrier protein
MLTAVATAALSFWLAVDTPATQAGGTPAPAAAPQPDAEKTADAVQRYYDGAKDLHAKFEQTLTTAMGTKKKATGEVWLKKPGRMRWDYAKPEKKLMVADGETLWVYEPEDEQAFKQELRSSNLPDSVAFLLGEGKLKAQFDVKAEPAPPAGVAQPGEVVLRLVPKRATSAYKALLFVVDPKTGAVNGTVVYDQQGGQSHIRFSALETNKAPEDGKFKFTPPAGTRILKP